MSLYVHVCACEFRYVCVLSLCSLRVYVCACLFAFVCVCACVFVWLYISYTFTGSVEQAQNVHLVVYLFIGKAKSSM